MKSFPCLDVVRKITDANYTEACLSLFSENCRGISTDTRTIKPGEIFVALEGENFDGHDFIPQAFAKGALACIVKENSPKIKGLNSPLLMVKSPLVAYQQIAKWWRKSLNLPVIGVTGSVGKTTTKELISAVLSLEGRVLKTEANYNNEIGVPKTILQIDETHKYAVIEMAMRGRGQIALLTEIAQPNIGVITNVGTAHIGILGSREAIAEAKCELLANMDKSGVAIINGDNELLVETAKKFWQGETICYGLKSGNFRGELVDKNTLKVDNKLYPLPLTGEHNALNYLAAIATAKVLGLDLQKLQQGIKINLPRGRATRHVLPNNIILLDETYNAGFESMIASLKLLAEEEGKRRIAVLGTMKELGNYSASLHRQVGEFVKSLNLDLLLILADEDATKEIAHGAQGIPTRIFHNHQELLSTLSSIIEPGDRILFKASHSLDLAKVVDGLVELFKQE
ncbi:MAG: UDP-N-acetylmuramoyl-tripeptide--D-alanyl-D-alanine ligase [Geminocystis sp.]|nr:UDP-N-acetylmuramoyl-tripeptide--D-alanyl-D-alanine ligase [Geminocystis sp.]HIK37943.1 UDP-N-acetylmuramoyl-tripeptide--D-alanyl-D-alanine ligase [Geminocystis sp. M7585_C2015_104]MCS7147697.1 UDP-N-acetylmuramoyl-tripeptide--D-alanyl-D-alanine ligase [Geminocystis sp.]MCX8077573.1 UDP-N-acetylmuramoyl-tripeptide--D-alanyl-D-alanine ligase [Geminocystis sp.]MDW8117346.1 UDP-N-acetylmuramoyl-tripeptide--D-alanyl-D-alanine ligase [Geminocystis sp.]